MNSIEKNKLIEGENNMKERGIRFQIWETNGYQINSIPNLEEITNEEKQRRRERERGMRMKKLKKI